MVNRDALIAEAMKRGLIQPQQGTPAQEEAIAAMPSIQDMLTQQPAQPANIDAVRAEAIKRGLIPAPIANQAVAEPQPNVSTLGATARGIKQGLTGAFSDEIQAGIGAAIAAPFVQDRTMGQLYEEALGANRKELAQDVNQQPLASIGGEVVGAVINPINKILPSASIAQRLGAAAATGAVYGAGKSEGGDTSADALKSAGISTAIQGGLETVAAPLRALKPITRYLTKPSAEKTAVLESVGMPATLGAVSDSVPVQRFQNVLANLPFGSKITKQMNDAYGVADDLLAKSGYTGKTTPTVAGEAVKSGLDNYVKKGQQVFAKIDAALDKAVPGDAVIKLPDDMKKQLVGIFEAVGRNPETIAEKISNPSLRKVYELAQKGQSTFRDIKDIRTELGDVAYAPGNEAAKASLKQARGILNQNLSSALKETFGDDVAKIAKRRDAFYAAFKSEEDNLLKDLQKLGEQSPEKLFDRVISGGKLGGTRISAVTAKLPKAQRDILLDGFIAHAGKSGDEFSASRYFNKFRQLQPEAKQGLFAGNKDLLQSHEEMAKAVGILDDVMSKGNPSQTAYALNLQNILLSGGAGVMGAGAVLTSPFTVMAPLASAYGLSTLFANDRAVKALAGLTTATAKNNGKQIAKELSTISKLIKMQPYLASAFAPIITSYDKPEEQPVMKGQ